jgi:hypothetical protein
MDPNLPDAETARATLKLIEAESRPAQAEPRPAPDAPRQSP